MNSFRSTCLQSLGILSASLLIGLGFNHFRVEHVSLNRDYFEISGAREKPAARYGSQNAEVRFRNLKRIETFTDFSC